MSLIKPNKAAEKFTAFFREKNLLNQSFNFLVAVSGGVDSVSLCELCKQSGLNFTIAHCNFQLRGEESEQDEDFVKALGAKYGVEVLVKKFDTEKYAADQKLSIQEAARNLRYEWFAELGSMSGFSHTLVAHHADDNIETLLMNFFRGTGLQGLTGIPAAPRGILRPMLEITREEILQFANENNLKWVEDSSNSSSKYTRNFFRNELIPAIQKVYPQVNENLLDNIDRFTKVNALYELTVRNLKDKLLVKTGNEVRIPILKLLSYQHTSLIFEIIRDYGFGEKQVGEVLKLTGAGSGKFIANEKYQLIRHGRWLIISEKSIAGQTMGIEKDVSSVEFADGRIDLRIIANEKIKIDKSEEIAQLDTKNIEFPLLLRKWKQGDYFYPLGMRKKKKLARFFIDRKLPKNQKENVWVIESNKRIIWVVGMRIDDRFKLTDKTKEVLVITRDR